VEDDAQRALALQLGATHWQGWHLAQPAADFIADVQAA
jgi:EAL domain-containing protein (putative c-di-GMP-specific phosphodiesterase class I)